MNQKELLAEIRPHLEKVYGTRLQEIMLYGSEARGVARPDSDIDILVILQGPIHVWNDLHTAFVALYPLSLRLGRPLSIKPVDIQKFQSGKYPLYETVKKEGCRL